MSRTKRNHRNAARPRLPAPRGPSARTRALCFVFASLVGGLIGYGMITSGPGPAPSVFEPKAAAWVFGLAAVCGTLAALSPKGLWHRGRYAWKHEPDD